MRIHYLGKYQYAAIKVKRGYLLAKRGLNNNAEDDFMDAMNIIACCIMKINKDKMIALNEDIKNEVFTHSSIFFKHYIKFSGQ